MVVGCGSGTLPSVVGDLAEGLISSGVVGSLRILADIRPGAMFQRVEC